MNIQKCEVSIIQNSKRSYSVYIAGVRVAGPKPYPGAPVIFTTESELSEIVKSLTARGEKETP